MLYSLAPAELAKLRDTHLLYDFRNAEMLVATFRTDFEIAREILPRPLSPSGEGLATAFVARYPETNFGCVYNEGALSLHCEYRGEKGWYVLSMPVDDDMAMIGGREQFGYPKKLADKIALEKDGDSVTGSVVRRGTEILRIQCRLGGVVDETLMNDAGVPALDWDGVPCYKIIVFLTKYFQSPRGDRFDYLPRLIREPLLFRPKGTIRQGSGHVVLTSTPWDPLAEVPVGEVVRLFYGVWHNTMLPGRVVARIWNPLRFARHAFFKTDGAAYLLEQYDATGAARAREVFKAAKRY
jgi:acetoacetate decarboxylase